MFCNESSCDPYILLKELLPHAIAQTCRYHERATPEAGQRPLLTHILLSHCYDSILVTGSRSEALKDFLSQLFEPARYVVPMIEQVKVPTDIGHEYKQALTYLSSEHILEL